MGGHEITFIQKYNDPQKAIDALHLFSRIGHHTNDTITLYHLLGNYIVRDILTYDLVIGIMSMFGYRDDDRLQNIIQVAISHGCQHSKNDLPELFLTELADVLDYTTNPLYRIFSDLYGVLCIYDFFKCPKYHKNPRENDLSEVIEKILNIIKPELI